MANHKSAAKRARQTIKRSARNSATRNKVRTFERKLRMALEANQADEAKALLISFVSQIHRAAQKGVVNAKAASRKVGRLASQVDRLH